MLQAFDVSAAVFTRGLTNLKTVLTTNDPPKIKEAITRLEGSAYRIADAIYTSESKA